MSERKRTRGPELGQLDVPLRVETQIRRLHLTVRDPCLVRGVERRCHLVDPHDHLIRRLRPLLLQALLERAPGQVVHDGVGLSFPVAHVVERDGVRMRRERRRRERLADEPLTHCQIVVETARQHSHSHQAPE